MLSMITVTL